MPMEARAWDGGGEVAKQAGRGRTGQHWHTNNLQWLLSLIVAATGVIALVVP